MMCVNLMTDRELILELIGHVERPLGATFTKSWTVRNGYPDLVEVDRDKTMALLRELLARLE